MASPPPPPPLLLSLLLLLLSLLLVVWAGDTNVGHQCLHDQLARKYGEIAGSKPPVEPVSALQLETATTQQSVRCNGVLKLTDPQGTFTTGPGPYENNKQCDFFLVVPNAERITVTFHEFNTERNYDFVHVFDGRNHKASLLAKLHGEPDAADRTFTSSEGHMYIIFKTDASVTREGFTATYVASYGEGRCTNRVELTEPSGILASALPPRPYLSYQNCTWIIQPPHATEITLTFSAFDIERSYDWVKVWNTTTRSATPMSILDGNTLPHPVLSNTGVMRVEFSSDYSVSKQGFEASYEAVIPQGKPKCSGLETRTDMQGTIASGTPYDNHMSCQWLLEPQGATAVVLKFTEIETERGYDYVEVYDGGSSKSALLANVTGTPSVPLFLTSSGPKMFVWFKSDYSITRKGFSAQYSSVEGRCAGSTILTEDTGVLKSGGSSYANNQECTWLITPPDAGSVSLTLTSFDLEKNYDKLYVYDGDNTAVPVLGVLTGDLHSLTHTSFTSHTGRMLVRFVSDYSIVREGFKATYTSDKAPSPSPSASSPPAVSPSPTPSKSAPPPPSPTPSSSPAPQLPETPIRITADTRYLEYQADGSRACYSVGQTFVIGDGSGICSDTIIDDCRGLCTADDVWSSAKRDSLILDVIPSALEFLRQSLSIRYPPAGRISIPYDTCGVQGGVPVPRSHQSPGIDADIVLYFTARPTMGNTIAWAYPCMRDEATKRPTFGMVNIGMATVVQHETMDIARTVVHELIHVLGFSPTSYRYWRTATGEPLCTNPAPDGTCPTIVARVDGEVNTATASPPRRIFYKLTTPHVRDTARDHYGCASVDGLELEDDGGTGSAGSHFEKRLVGPELMSSIQLGFEKVFSRFTMAVLEDTGWYNVLHNKAEFLRWGHKEGCSFILGHCRDWPSTYVCIHNVTLPGGTVQRQKIWGPHHDNTDSYCMPDRTRKAHCMTYLYSPELPSWERFFDDDPRRGGYSPVMDYCPVYLPLADSKCTKSGTSSDFSFEEYGPESRCFQGTVRFDVTSTSNKIVRDATFCLRHQCVPSLTNPAEEELWVRAADCTCANEVEWRSCSCWGKCPPEGGTLEHAFFSLRPDAQSLIDCPPVSFCEDSRACPANCSGHGQCVANQCQCDSGYEGFDCSLRT
eukprot:TRINITY_DN877_c4_g1_i1.p1 TRINITY_DN877_c4_g1~~TRINITY_DN877_c4_g1_i1.p1  ORF type:complete len:1153 (+),score=215.35 TRINITY_DN877_c4_g1_i1:30-3461(+)